MTPLTHDVPLVVDVAQPMSDAPPSKKRPNCPAATRVEPNEYESGSTIVLCWLVEFVKGSVAILTIGIVALAATLSTSAAAATVPRTSAKRPLRGRGWKRMCLLLARRTRSRISVSTSAAKGQEDPAAPAAAPPEGHRPGLGRPPGRPAPDRAGRARRGRRARPRPRAAR